MRDEVWRYADDHSEVNKVGPRPCTKCKRKAKDYGGHDPCIAALPGVVNACCGHGVHDGYISFKDGRTIRGRFEMAWEKLTVS